MKKMIDLRLDFIKINTNPITLLVAIKEHALNYQENRYSMSIIFYYKAEGRENSTRLHKQVFCGTRCAQVPYWGTYNPNQVCQSHGWVE